MPEKPFTPITILDTTLRDGEMMPGIQFNVYQKVDLAQQLEALGVDVIEVGYPSANPKDFDEISKVSQSIKTATICGLARTDPKEIVCVARALKPAANARIHVFTPIHLRGNSAIDPEQTLSDIRDGIRLCRCYCDQVEWSAFDATRCDRDFLCRTVETAIAAGATIVNIPDTVGLASTTDFCQLITDVVNRVPNIEQAILSVHCHNDLGHAVENSIAALNAGARQIECSIQGLGARKGNADLAEIATAIAQSPNYSSAINLTLLPQISSWVADTVARMSF